MWRAEELDRDLQFEMLLCLSWPKDCLTGSKVWASHPPKRKYQEIRETLATFQVFIENEVFL